MQRFLSELQRRKVLRVASAYVVAGWVILQVSLALQTAMKLPESFSTIILALLVIGFPVALILSWLFEFTPDGIKRTVTAGGGELTKPQTTDLILAAALGLVIIVAVGQLLTPGMNTPASTAPTAATTQPKPETPALGDKSIAVLPFANMSSDRENDYFAKGLTEELLNLLTQLRGLKVVSRTSSFAFESKDTQLPEIAKKLGVRHILEGSVRRDGDDLRITAQLIDVTTDTHLWSKTYERKFDAIFALQDEIARGIANALDVELAVSDAPNSAPTTDLEAYRLFLKARELFRLRKTKDIIGSVDLYKQAIERDSKFAEAYSGLSLSYSVLLSANITEFARYAPLMQVAAETAISLKPSLAQPHAVLSAIARQQLDWEGARAYLEKAQSLDAADPMVLFMRGIQEVSVGYVDRAYQTFVQAERADPLYLTVRALLASTAFARGDERTYLTIANKLAGSDDEFAIFGETLLAYHAREHSIYGEAERHTRIWLKLRGWEESPIAGPLIAGMKSKSAVQRAIKVIDEERAKNPKFGLMPLFLLGAEEELIARLNSELQRGGKARVSLYFPSIWGIRQGASGPEFKEFVQNAGLVAYWKKHGWPDRCRAKGEDDFECS